MGAEFKAGLWRVKMLKNHWFYKVVGRPLCQGDMPPHINTEIANRPDNPNVLKEGCKLKCPFVSRDNLSEL